MRKPEKAGSFSARGAEEKGAEARHEARKRSPRPVLLCQRRRTCDVGEWCSISEKAYVQSNGHASCWVKSR